MMMMKKMMMMMMIMMRSDDVDDDMMIIVTAYFLSHRVGHDLPGLHQKRYLIMSLLASISYIPR